MKRCLLAVFLCFLAACGADSTPPPVLPDEKPAQQEQQTLVETPSANAEQTEEAYSSPIDFEALQSVNEDIYAWLHIPGAEISYPVLQHPEDDSFYLTHDSEGNEKNSGALFTEHVYNSKDFNDLVTIIYGHRMNTGTMFDGLQPFYSNPENFHSQQEITVYLPDRELTYQVFAAVVYDNRHILDNYDFSRSRIYQAFFESIFEIRSFNSNLDMSCELDYDSKVLILSTCLQGDYSQRYLVFAKQIS